MRQSDFAAMKPHKIGDGHDSEVFRLRQSVLKSYSHIARYGTLVGHTLEQYAADTMRAREISEPRIIDGNEVNIQVLPQGRSRFVDEQGVFYSYGQPYVEGRSLEDHKGIAESYLRAFSSFVREVNGRLGTFFCEAPSNAKLLVNSGGIHLVVTDLAKDLRESYFETEIASPVNVRPLSELTL